MGWNDHFLDAGEDEKCLICGAVLDAQGCCPNNCEDELKA